MDLVAAVVAHEESFVVVEAGERALDDPADAAEAGAVFGPAASDFGLDPPGAQLAAVPLSEHKGDARPNTLIHLYVSDIDAGSKREPC